MIRPMIAMAMLVPVTCVGADDLKVSQLEQDVRDLQRQVQALTRQLETPRGAVAPAAIAPARPREAAAPAATIPAWVDAAKWSLIRPGMGELEVVGLLGAPTSMRVEDGARVLFYAMEIGASGFLGGNVRLKDRSVVSVSKPTLQ